MNTIRIWFTKTGEASYISLLDLQRVMHRSLKRSGLPVWYTMGFNPHIYLTFACPLPLGQESLVESVDCKTEQESIDFDEWRTTLNTVMPLGIVVTKVEPVRIKAEHIGFARYTVTCRNPGMKAALDAYNEAESVSVQKKSKRGLKTIEMKEYLPHIEAELEGEGCRFEALLPASETVNLNPSLLLNYIAEKHGIPATDSAILRTALYTKSNEPFSPENTAEICSFHK